MNTSLQALYIDSNYQLSFATETNGSCIVSVYSELYEQKKETISFFNIVRKGSLEISISSSLERSAYRITATAAELENVLISVWIFIKRQAEKTRQIIHRIIRMREIERCTLNCCFRL